MVPHHGDINRVLENNTDIRDSLRALSGLGNLRGSAEFRNLADERVGTTST